MLRGVENELRVCDFSNNIAVRVAFNGRCKGCRVVLEQEHSAPTNLVPVPNLDKILHSMK